ncbi:hypothetical protein BH23GEM4_BH23GEM4_01270 [soil metagenome]
MVASPASHCETCTAVRRCRISRLTGSARASVATAAAIHTTDSAGASPPNALAPARSNAETPRITVTATTAPVSAFAT